MPGRHATRRRDPAKIKPVTLDIKQRQCGTGVSPLSCYTKAIQHTCASESKKYYKIFVYICVACKFRLTLTSLTMTKCYIFFFLIVGHAVFAQNNNPTKSQLLKVLKKSIRQDTKDRVSTNSNPWVVCNKDSSFYKSDTLRLYNNVNYRYYSKCCNFVDLTFYKKNAFVIVKTQICKEPPTGSVATPNDWFTIRLSNDRKDLILETINQDKIVDRFKVISIGKVDDIGQPNDITNILTLVRQSRTDMK